VSSDVAHLQGPWLRAARVGWLLLFTITVLTLVAAFPARWGELTHPSARVLANLSGLGWPVMTYAILMITGEAVFAAVYLIVGLIIFVRRPDELMALFTALMLVAFGVGNQTITLTVAALRHQPLGYAAYIWGGYMAWVTFTQFAYLFPSGRYVPRWSIIPAVLWFVLVIPWNFMVGTPYYPPGWPPIIFGPLFILLWGSVAASQIYRYTRVSSPVERQQIKWVAYALVMIGGVLIIMVLVAFAVNINILSFYTLEKMATPNQFAFGIYAQSGATLAFLLLPVALAFSILRYRLWDIDVIIRRTLQYSLLSGLLALIYFSGVALLQGLLSRLTGQAQSPLVVVGSTLLIAALFNPLRLRIRAFIDRRFYRARYDAERTLARFAATARDEVDIERLTDALLGAVEDTMQPRQIALWLDTWTGKRDPTSRDTL